MKQLVPKTLLCTECNKTKSRYRFEPKERPEDVEWRICYRCQMEVESKWFSEDDYYSLIGEGVGNR